MASIDVLKQAAVLTGEIGDRIEAALLAGADCTPAVEHGPETDATAIVA